MEVQDKFLHRERTYKIIGLCMEIQNELGYGFLEKVYENALLCLIEDAGLNFENQAKIDVHFRHWTVGKYIADIIVENKIIIELKSVETLSSHHVAQTINYLKATGIKIGLLINFGKSKLEYKRLIF